MPGDRSSPVSGFTLTELLVALTVISFLLTWALPAWNNLVERERVIAATNRLHGLLRYSRSQALGRSPVVVCNRQCEGIDDPLRITVFRDANHNFRADPGEAILRRVVLEGLTTLQWRHFNGPDGLRYRPTGLLYYQNGHYLLCAGKHGMKIVMNWIGRTYVEKAGSDDCPAS